MNELSPLTNADEFEDHRVSLDCGGRGPAGHPEREDIRLMSADFAAGDAPCFHPALKLVGEDADLTDSAVSAGVGIGMMWNGGFRLAVELDVHALQPDSATASRSCSRRTRSARTPTATRDNVESR